jgi:hypothetical protein
MKEILENLRNLQESVYDNLHAHDLFQVTHLLREVETLLLERVAHITTHQQRKI